MKFYTYNQMGLHEGIRIRSRTTSGAKDTEWYLGLGEDIPAPPVSAPGSMPGSKRKRVTCSKIFPPQIHQTLDSNRATIWIIRRGDVAASKKQHLFGRELADDKRVLILSRNNPMSDNWPGVWRIRRYFGPGDIKTFVHGVTLHTMRGETAQTWESLEILDANTACLLALKSDPQNGCVLYNQDGELTFFSRRAFRDEIVAWKRRATTEEIQKEQGVAQQSHFQDIVDLLSS